jgi:vacuolar-type H+-ATPase subunit C/Vma6
MKPPGVNDLDFLGALLHGRRSRVAEGTRLEALCHLRTVVELERSIYPEVDFRSLADFQRRLVQNLPQEMAACERHLEGGGSRLVSWMQLRFQIENIKVLLRGVINQVPPEDLYRYLVSLPHHLAVDNEALSNSASLDDFILRLPLGMPRRWLRNAVSAYGHQPQTFFLEAAMDCGYLQELLTRADVEQDTLKPLICQEVDTFHLMLLLRGKFHYGLPPEKLLPLHVRGSNIPADRFLTMGAEPDPLAAAAHALGRALDTLPASPETTPGSGTLNLANFEALAWTRFLRLANRAFRRSHMGLGTVVGYLCMRRIEVTNLISLSEAIRAGLHAEKIGARLLPRQELESAYV